MQDESYRFEPVIKSSPRLVHVWKLVGAPTPSVQVIRPGPSTPWGLATEHVIADTPALAAAASFPE